MRYASFWRKPKSNWEIQGVLRLAAFKLLKPEPVTPQFFVFDLDEGDGNVRFVVENVVGALGLATGDQPAADDDPAFGERDLLSNLRQDIPARLLDSGRDELSADVAFAEVFLVL